MAFLLGIDGGGTKTIGLLGNAHCQVLERVEGGPTNYHVVGIERVGSRLREMATRLCAPIGGIGEVSAAALGLAGVARPDDQERLSPVLSRLGFPPQTLLTHDARVGLVAGTGRDEGVILIAGTGSIAYGRSKEGEEARAGGWGSLLGDEGGGYGLGLEALRAVARSADGRNPPTRLTDSILSALRLAKPDMLIRWAQDASKADIAALSPLVFEAAEQGDSVAKSILEAGAAALGEIASVILRRLQWNEPPTLVLSGGLFEHPSYREAVARGVMSRFLDLRIAAPSFEPAYGALLLARGLLES